MHTRHEIQIVRTILPTSKKFQSAETGRKTEGGERAGRDSIEACIGGGRGGGSRVVHAVSCMLPILDDVAARARGVRRLLASAVRGRRADERLPVRARYRWRPERRTIAEERLHPLSTRFCDSSALAAHFGFAMRHEHGPWAMLQLPPLSLRKTGLEVVEVLVTPDSLITGHMVGNAKGVGDVDALKSSLLYVHHRLNCISGDDEGRSERSSEHEFRGCGVLKRRLGFARRPAPELDHEGVDNGRIPGLHCSPVDPETSSRSPARCWRAICAVGAWVMHFDAHLDTSNVQGRTGPERVTYGSYFSIAAEEHLMTNTSIHGGIRQKMGDKEMIEHDEAVGFAVIITENIDDYGIRNVIKIRGRVGTGSDLSLDTGMIDPGMAHNRNSRRGQMDDDARSHAHHSRAGWSEFPNFNFWDMVEVDYNQAEITRTDS
ncbi:hypothetical protein B0H11DRAFT_2267535 [Mycena galericulata]|nr:hypothetical protein B0H11DRAFT_2267535 [Mycena galericulata]